MNKWFFRIIFSLFIFISGCCLVFTPISSYNSYSVRSKLQDYWSSYLEHLTSNRCRLLFSVEGVSDDAINSLSDVGILRVFGIYCEDSFCESQGYGKDKVSPNYAAVLSNGVFNRKSIKNINQLDNRGTSLLEVDYFEEMVSETKELQFLKRYKNSYLNALNNIYGTIASPNSPLFEQEANSYSSTNKFRDNILKEIKSNRKDWRRFRFKTKTIAIAVPIFITIIAYYVIQMIFLLWFIDFIVFGGKKGKNNDSYGKNKINS